MCCTLQSTADLYYSAQAAEHLENELRSDRKTEPENASELLEKTDKTMAGHQLLSMDCANWRTEWYGETAQTLQDI